MIELNQLTFQHSAQQPVQRFDASLPQRQITMVLGENGSGKSTLLKLLLGILKPTAGRILFAGDDITNSTVVQRAERMAYLPQSHHAVFNYAVGDVILMGCSHQLSPLQQPQADHRERMVTIAEQLGIAALLRRGYREISGGERQLVLLARALMQQASALIMDEPTANLDLVHRQTFFTHCHQLVADGYTIVMSTHQPEYALRHADYIVALKNGQVIRSGAVAQTLDDNTLSTIYQLPLTIRQLDEHYLITHEENA